MGRLRWEELVGRVGEIDVGRVWELVVRRVGEVEVGRVGEICLDDRIINHDQCLINTFSTVQ